MPPPEPAAELLEAPASAPSVEEVKAASRGLRGALGAELGDGRDAFSRRAATCSSSTGCTSRTTGTSAASGPARVRSLDHIFMVRASVPGGALSADQWRAIDHVADAVADGAVRLTSRGGVQLHFVRKGGLRPLIRTLDGTW